MGIGFMGLASKINAASQTHTCSHSKQGVEGGHASLVTLSDEKDTQISFMSVTLRAELNTVVCFFYHNSLDCGISPLQQGAISTPGLRQIEYLKHPPVSCDSLHGFLFLSELTCSFSGFDQAMTSRSRLTGTSLVAVKGHGTGVTTGRNGD